DRRAGEGDSPCGLARDLGSDLRADLVGFDFGFDLARCLGPDLARGLVPDLGRRGRAASRRSSIGCARRSRNSRDGGGGRRRSRPRTPPAPPPAAWAPSTWVAAPLVSYIRTRQTPSGSLSRPYASSPPYNPRQGSCGSCVPSPVHGGGTGRGHTRRFVPAAPSPTLPRKREREQTEIAATRGESLHLCRSLALCRSFPRKRESRGRSPWPWVPAFAGTNEWNFLTTSRLRS